MCCCTENEFNKDNKSWLQCKFRNYLGNTAPIKFYNFNGGPFNINTITYQSQWMAVDRRHLNLFFNEKNSKLIKTYKTIKYEEIMSFNKIFQSYLDSYKLYDINNNLIPIKYISDNTFFIAIISSKIIKSKIDFINNIKTTDKDFIYNVLKYEWIKKRDDNKNENQLLKIERKDYSHLKIKNMYNTSKMLAINPKNLAEIYFVYDINNDKYILKNKKFVKIKTNKKVIEKGTKKGIFINLYTIPSTYVEWDLIALEPSNFLRDYDIFLKEKNNQN